MNKSIAKIIVYLHQGSQGLMERLLSVFYKRSFGNCGSNVRIRPLTSVFKGVNNIYIGNDVSIPKYSTIFCTEAPLVIGNKVTFGPSPTIVTGDHRIDVLGKFIIDCHVKKAENDLPIIIEDDVWVGANVIILKGVRICRGSVIAAGTLVNKNVPPYSIFGGSPGRVIRFRFSKEAIIEHEKSLYPQDRRLEIGTLEKILNHHNLNE